MPTLTAGPSPPHLPIGKWMLARPATACASVLRHHRIDRGTVIAVTDEGLQAARSQEGVSPGEAAKPRYRVRLPRFVVQEAVGLGEVVKRGTTALGMHPCGGCQQRATRLDRWVRFEPRR
jgi:hypothetical protein